MSGRRPAAAFRIAATALATVLAPFPLLRAQDLSPRVYTITPVRSNAVTLGNIFNDGNLLFDGSVPITGATGRLNVPSLTLYRSLSLFGRSANVAATLPYGVVTRFASLTTQVAAALPPFDVTYDLKLHWHRRFDNEPRSIWLRDQLATVFKDHQWLQPPAGPAPFLDS